MAEVNKITMESPKNFKKENTRKKKIGNKSKKQIASTTDIRYFYPKTYEDMWPHAGFIEYKMSPATIKDLLTNRNKLEEKVDPQKYLCDYVNEQCGLMGYCVRVITE